MTGRAGALLWVLLLIVGLLAVRAILWPDRARGDTPSATSAGVAFPCPPGWRCRVVSLRQGDAEPVPAVVAVLDRRGEVGPSAVPSARTSAPTSSGVTTTPTRTPEPARTNVEPSQSAVERRTLVPGTTRPPSPTRRTAATTASAAPVPVPAPGPLPGEVDLDRAQAAAEACAAGYGCEMGTVSAAPGADVGGAPVAGVRMTGSARAG